MISWQYPDVLRTGTPVTLCTNEELTAQGRRLRVATHFDLEVAEAVSVGGRVVIPAGTPVVGDITEVRHKGMWGKSAHLTAQLRYLTLDGRQVRLAGTFDDKGVTGTAGVVGVAVLIPVAGFFLTGTSVRTPAISNVAGFVAEDVALAFATAPAAPMVVPAPPAPTTPTAR